MYRSARAAISAFLVLLALSCIPDPPAVSPFEITDTMMVTKEPVFGWIFTVEGVTDMVFLQGAHPGVAHTMTELDDGRIMVLCVFYDDPMPEGQPVYTWRGTPTFSGDLCHVFRLYEWRRIR